MAPLLWAAPGRRVAGAAESRLEFTLKPEIVWGRSRPTGLIPVEKIAACKQPLKLDFRPWKMAPRLTPSHLLRLCGKNQDLPADSLDLKMCGTSLLHPPQEAWVGHLATA